MLATEHLKLDSYLRTLVEKASFLTERLNHEVIPTGCKSDISSVDSHLEFWREVLAKGNDSVLQQRLAADDWDEDKLRVLLGAVEYPHSKPLPSWAQILKLVLQATEKPLSIDTESNSKIPFEPFYQPFIQVAQNLLSSRINLNILSEEAQKSLWSSLTKRLRNIATPTLFKEFHQFRSTGNPLQDFLLIQLQGKNSQKKYHAFLQHLSQKGLLDLFDKYPVLGKLLATAIDYWVDATAEFIQRLRTDWLAIATLFSPQTALQQVVELKANLSDLHNQGRSVIALTFDTGLQLVYKPKNMEMELAYNKVISWCNEHGSPLPLKTFTVLHQGKYGWVEFVNQYDCDDEAAAERYYIRAGMILAVIHLLLGTDCHYENLIASGEHPVLIDLETLLTHETRVSYQSNSTVPLGASDIAQKQLETSLLRTMLLPQRGLIPKDSVEIDLSGFGGVEEYESPMLKLNHVNTDGMNMGYEVVSVESNPNAPKVNGVNLSPLTYLEHLVAGFEQMYRFFVQHKQSLLQADSPLMGLANQTIRYVFRATHIYHSIVQSSYSPEFLDSGIKRSLGLEVLARAFVVNKTMLDRIGILNAERQAVENGDIPFFTINTSELHLPLPGEKAIGDLFVQSSFDTMVEQLQQLNETDLARQVNVIKGSFAARYTEEPKLPKNSFPITNVGENSIDIDIDIDSHIFVKQAINLAEELKQKAIFGEEGSVCWLGLSYKTTTEGFLFQPLGSNLYDGNCGIALFLAALAKITGDSQWSDLALSSLKSILQLQQIQPSEETARLLRKSGIGGATGLTSMAYSLVHISKFLADDGLLTTAKKIALLITPQLIASEKYLDVTRGVAGTILGLLAVYKNSPDDNLLNLAINCGEHLLEQQVSIDERKTWQTWNGIALTGFSQGASGIADALLRLWEVSGREDFLEAAQTAISYESSYFSQEAGNWQDLRPQTPDYQLNWSHGAAGIALARLKHQHQNPQISEEINIALETIQKYGIWGIDNLAWGNFGRIETLLVASQILNRPELLQLARSWSIKLIEQAGAKGNFTLYDNIISPVHNPAFLHGTSGIGYQLLRLAHPELPSILSFDF